MRNTDKYPVTLEEMHKALERAQNHEELIIYPMALNKILELLPFDQQTYNVILELAEHQHLSPAQLIRHAVARYQLSLFPVEPLSKLPPNE